MPLERPMLIQTQDNIFVKKREARDISATVALAFGFIVPKEVVVAPWFKKPDVEIVDASRELLTIHLDATLPVLHQEAIVPRE